MHPANIQEGWTKQPTSKFCFVCGRDNPIGFHMEFYADDEDRVHAEYVPCEEHQGFPGVMHGGLISALLDEIIGRASIMHNIWCMTARLEIRYKKPVPIGEPIKLMGELTQMKSRVIEGHGELRLASDESLLAEANGTYVRIPDDQLARYASALQWWTVT